MIEAIVAIVFGAVITAVGVYTSANVAIIVLGAILIAVGLGCLIYEIISSKKKASSFKLIVTEYETKISNLETELLKVKANGQKLFDSLKAEKATVEKVKTELAEAKDKLVAVEKSTKQAKVSTTTKKSSATKTAKAKTVTKKSTAKKTTK